MNSLCSLWTKDWHAVILPSIDLTGRQHGIIQLKYTIKFGTGLTYYDTCNDAISSLFHKPL